MKRKNIQNKIFYFAVLVLATLFLFIGSTVVRSGTDDTLEHSNQTFFQGVVTEITDDTTEDFFGGMTSRTVTFTVRITRGELRGQYVQAMQHIHEYAPSVEERAVSSGDRVLLVAFDDVYGYNFANFVRTNYIIILGLIFVAVMLLFARKRGFNTIIALAFTCLAIFVVFIPSIINGNNIYLATIIVCIYTILVTLSLVVGLNKKALSAILGCLGGVVFSAILMVLMDSIMQLTGLLDNETVALLYLPTDSPINLRAIVFAGVTLGVVGAIMDVSMSISSSLWEIEQVGEKTEFRKLFNSGLNIGRDILGTMLNTLIIAYIGSSISLILIIYAHSTSMAELFNMELIIVELLRALVGSFGMLLTIPLTSVICGWLYTTTNKAKSVKVDPYSQKLSDLDFNGSENTEKNG